MLGLNIRLQDAQAAAEGAASATDAATQAQADAARVRAALGRLHDRLQAAEGRADAMESEWIGMKLRRPQSCLVVVGRSVAGRDCWHNLKAGTPVSQLKQAA